nr:FAD-binding protein [Sphingomonas sp. CDS-1]
MTMKPEGVSEVSAFQWDTEVDVLVIGFGAAGACAALQAWEDGARVMLVDRFDGGGTTAASGGVIYAGATRFQAEAGFDDDIDNMMAYLATEVGDVVSPETLRRFCEGSAADLDWLIANGLAFSSEAHLAKASFPPEGKYLYYSGNEKAPANAAVARPVPRGHRPVGAGFGGRHFHEGLAKRIAQTSIEVRTHCWAQRLVVGDHKRVAGVELAFLDDAYVPLHSRLYANSNPITPKDNKVHEQSLQEIEKIEAEHSRSLKVKVRGGVILATGGYAFNTALLSEFNPAIVQADAKFHRLATLGNDGTGMEMGRLAGGVLRRMNSLYIARHIVPAALTKGILINSAGKRFIAEDAYISLIGEAISRQEGGNAWLIINASTFRKALKQVFGSGWHLFRYYAVRILPNILLGGTRRAGRLERLAKTLGLPVESLLASVSAHDEDVDAGLPDRLGKSPDGRLKLGSGPYYAINMKFSNRHALTLLMTLGGLSVDEEDGSVLHADGSKIEGLFAAGNCAVGLHSNGYISGLAIADCVFAGRRAGRSASSGKAGDAAIGAIERPAIDRAASD